MIRSLIVATLACSAGPLFAGAHVSVSGGGGLPSGPPSVSVETTDDTDGRAGVSLSISTGNRTLTLNSLALPPDPGTPSIDPLPSLNDIIECAGPTALSGCASD
ncbi:MAG: hypothetical protein ACU0BS_10535 [Hasllibacter sp.]